MIKFNVYDREATLDIFDSLYESGAAISILCEKHIYIGKIVAVDKDKVQIQTADGTPSFSYSEIERVNVANMSRILHGKHLSA